MKSMLPIVMVVTLLSACQREEAAAPTAEPQTTATSTPMAEAPAPAPAVDDTARPPDRSARQASSATAT